MDRMIYLSMSGAKASMQRQDVLANNLANVSTNGFRAELAAFRAVPVQGSGASTRVYSLESTVGSSFEPGAVTPTGRPLDVAMKGNAWLAVQGLDGTVNARDAQGRSNRIGRLKLVSPESPATLQRGPDGLFRAAEGDLGADATARLQDGALEGSNVNPISAMVDMIAVARQFEVQMRMLQNAERNDQTASQLLSLTGG